VTKETAAMVLTDDNFASIVSAVEEGRIIYSNIRKFVYYLLSCNVGEILILSVAMVIGLSVPLQPVQLLWINLLTDGLPALALGLERGERDTMQRLPRPANESILNRDMQIGILVQAVVVPSVVLGAMALWLWRHPGDVPMAQTMAFVTLAGLELPLAYAFRSERKSIFSMGVFSNRYMVGATALSFSLMLAPLYVPGLQQLFEVESPDLSFWFMALPLIFVPFIAAEITKAAVRRREASEEEDRTMKRAAAA
jgi:Ca2+-transporting ATPase